MTRLSNRLADLAERAGDFYRLGNARSVEAAAAYLDCGRLLIDAKAEAGHGEWLPLLARAGIPYRSAARTMQLSKSGITPEALAARGIKAAAGDLGKAAKLPSVAHLDPDPEPRSDAPALPGRHERRRERKAAGLCLDCSKPNEGKARCPDCREAIAGRDRRRRAMAKIGEAVAAAAQSGSGLTLTADQVAALIGDRE